jgi:hypothetical protein
MCTDESRYSGGNDNFAYKLVIFHDLCSRADIPDDTKTKAYSTVLRELALDHYHTNIKGPAQAYNLSFDQIYEYTRTYFEGPEYKRGVLGQ